MIKLKEVKELISQLQQLKTFGNQYKITNYPHSLIDLAQDIDITTIDYLLSILGDNIPLERIQTEDIYNSINIFLEAYNSHKSNDSVKLPSVFINEQGEIKWTVVPIKAGQCLKVYNKDNNYIGKAIVITINTTTKQGNSKLFIEENSIPYYAEIDDWWLLNPIDIVWISEECLVKNSLFTAQMDVIYKSFLYTLGRIKWELYYEEKLMVKGADIFYPGRLLVAKDNSLFKEGNYKLKVIDRTTDYTLPLIGYIQWELDSNSSELKYGH